MKRNTDRILTMHAGSLARPPDLREMVLAKSNGQPYDAEALARRLRSAVAEVVQQQIAVGLDSINDGEFSKTTLRTTPASASAATKNDRANQGICWRGSMAATPRSSQNTLPVEATWGQGGDLYGPAHVHRPCCPPDRHRQF